MLVNNRKQMFFFLPEISVYLVFKNIVDVTSSFQPGFKTGRSFTSPHHPNKWKSSAHWKKSTFLLRFIREVRSQGKLLSPNLERLTGEYIYGESQLQSELCENQHWSRENLNCNSWISGGLVWTNLSQKLQGDSVMGPTLLWVLPPGAQYCEDGRKIS